MKFSAAVSTVQLPQNPKWNIQDNTNVVVAGFGRTYADGPISSVLQKVDARVISPKNCEAQYAGRLGAHLLDSHICAKPNTIDSRTGLYHGLGGTCFVSIIFCEIYLETWKNESYFSTPGMLYVYFEKFVKEYFLKFESSDNSYSV